MRILWIGNSYTQRNDLPAIVADMALSSQPAVLMQHERVIANGASLRQHWNAGSALKTIEGSNWDYVVLQEQSTLPIKNAARYHENVRLFHKAIQEQDAKTMLYLTWPRQSAPETQIALTEATMAIGREIGALIAPVGTAWQKALASRPELLFYDKDGSHPSTIGSYMAACVFYATLLQQSPAKLKIPRHLGLSEMDGHLVQSVAWEVVST